MFYYRNKLVAADQAMYDLVHSNWISRKRATVLPYNASPERIEKIITAVLLDNPDLYYIDKQRIAILSSCVGMTLQTDFRFKLDFRSIEQKKNDVLLLAKRKCAEKGETEKWKTIHGLVVRNVHYPATQAIDGSHHCIVGPLISHDAVCDGFSHFVKLLCDAVGIECIIVRGSARANGDTQYVEHAWNMIKLAGNWMHCDVTWDALSSRFPVQSYAYSYLSDFDISKDHSWDPVLTPKATSIPNRLMMLLVPIVSCSELSRVVEQNIKEAKSGVFVRFRQDMSNAEQKRSIHDAIYALSAKYLEIKLEYSFIEESSSLVLYIKRRY